MPTKRLTMRRIHRLMTLRFGAGASTRAIARELGIGHSTVCEYLARIAAAGITWPLPAEMTDAELEQRLFVHGGVHAGARYRAEPDWAVVARELRARALTTESVEKNRTGGKDATNEPGKGRDVAGGVSILGG